MTLDEIRQLDFKDMPNWQLPAQIGFMVIMALLAFALAYYALFSGMYDQLKQAQQQEEQLKDTFINKKQQVANLEALRAQLQQIEQSFNAMLKQLPSKAEMDSLLTEINQAGVGRGLQFELFRPAAEIRNEQLAELPIQIKLSGSYSDLATFATDVAKLSRIVTIGNITLNPLGAGPGEPRLTLDATARTYRALDPSEAAAAKPKK
ncbi:type 4a pilus biogenesis protein PilO [Vogesella sp. LIG4]|uniref:type 4a pilus biogenesis protein PilO n=1 Tax=Vogesella sp. LIG4 TaxID=1192162 RepID=UPI00081F766A|nr:type 4a pilus biogenesis protein PilO [Vogesella sp. LIG4]SCK15194.1 type IV pilus assembly protein PilO [Vogesella sp. LIG4]